MNCFILLAAVLAQAETDTDTRRAHWAREEEKAAAERLVAELVARDSVMLSNIDRIWLGRAYNELGRDADALSVINKIPEEWLAKNNGLDAKATYYHNVNFDFIHHRDRPFPQLVNELAFIQRCLDKGYGNRGVWLSRKARLLCRTSAHYLALQRGGDAIPVIDDREQYEDAFETLKQAFAAEPRLLEKEPLFLILASHGEFPVLCQEDRFKELMKNNAIPE